MARESKRVKYTARERTKFRIREKVFGDAVRPRFSVFRSSKHLYGQIINDVDGRTLAAASTLDSDVQKLSAKLVTGEKASTSTKSVAAARAVGQILAARAKSQKVSKVRFDRNGYVFHGRVKALADGAREAGLDF